MLNERDAERAIRKLDGKECGFKRRPLRTKDADRKRNARPSTTLFVVNF
ncbi:arginine/serine-rich-splicing factor RSP31, partial [Haematococcus lacustris]